VAGVREGMQEPGVTCACAWRAGLRGSAAGMSSGVGGGNGVAVGRELRCALLEEVSYGRSWQWCTGRAEMEEDSEKDFVILGTSLLA
jgi:hypothetical protein